ncbi:MAG: amidohydrolase family protein [Anaerolineae bacterium]
MPIIDFHIHPTKYEIYQQSAVDFIMKVIGKTEEFMEEMSTPASVVKMLQDCGVDYAVVLAEYSPVTTGVLGNEAIVEFCRDHDCLIPFASINPYMTLDPAKELERCVRELGCKGLKLYPTYNQFYPNDSRMYPVYATAQRLGIPVMFHTGSSVFRGARMKYGDPLLLDDIAVDFPDLVILQVHSGRGFWYDRAFFLAKLHPNVYMEIAGLPPQKLLDYFPDLERNADKIVFGSDWPGVHDIKANIEAIRALPIGEEAKEKILGGNAAPILGIPEDK